MSEKKAHYGGELMVLYPIFQVPGLSVPAELRPPASKSVRPLGSPGANWRQMRMRPG